MGQMGNSTTYDPKRNRCSLFDRLIGNTNEAAVTINGTTIKAIIDSGSMITTISEAFYESLDPKPQLFELSELQVKGADGGLIPYRGYIEAEIRVPGVKRLDVPVLVVGDTEYNLDVPVIVGTNVIRMLTKVDSPELSDAWKDAIHAACITSSMGIVKSAKEIEVKPLQTVTVSGLARLTGNVESAMTEETASASSRLKVCPRVVKIDLGGKTARVLVKILNISAKPMVIKPHTPLCELQEVKVLRSWLPEERSTEENRQNQEGVSSQAKMEFLSKMKFDLSHLANDHRQKFGDFLYCWKDVFSQHSLDLGNTDLVKHEIHLDKPEPFKEPYRRVPPGLMNEVREHLNEMLALGAIRPSKSPFSSNVVIVRKKDGTIRFCIDYRKLNSRTHKDAYALPRIDDTLHLLAGAQYFTKLDLKSGYWQVEMEESDKEKTAFQVGSLGFYESKRMPFGLCNAPATFQRLMERCMGDMNLRDCLIYLDDIIVFSESFDQHLH